MDIPADLEWVWHNRQYYGGGTFVISVESALWTNNDA